ncbi:hypothetical protein HYN69_10510 [Gemmobacter aquarius]|uniref:Arc-like DNA binding domain-containing protein n=1 Tax=Paragemmobacter aquarius TaxID=2169400 RepID=A0A2S0UM40_9RHOB|nr:Arc family DNA-binding protein [Gemmobacter aquarius]AWB48875.1 hypothetical protein HYN69_10510 [Gemmobacter aquarius]
MNRTPQFNVRWPEHMRDKIKASAERNRRSINSEVLLLIERGFTVPQDQPDLDGKAEGVAA